MSTSLLDNPVRLLDQPHEREREHEQQRRPEQQHGHGHGHGHGHAHGVAARSGGRCPTLEERLQGEWRTLVSDGTAECPCCHARMTLRNGSGHCGGCGSQLS